MTGSADRTGERASETSPWTDVLFGDGDRSRVALINQILISVVVVGVALPALAFSAVTTQTLFVSGAGLVLALTAAAIIMPWHALPAGWMAILPLGDMVGIALIRAGEPAGGFGLLWAFPVLWLASLFGLVGLVSAVLFALGCYAATIAFDPRQSTTFAVVLLPILLLGLGVFSFLSSRRMAAQRRLLDRQAGILTRSLERARRHEQMLTEALDRVDFGVARIEPDGSASIMNDAHARLQWGRTSGETADTEYFAPDGKTPLPSAEQPSSRVRRGEAFDDQRLWIGAEGGPRRVISVTARRLSDPDGHDAGAVVVTRDVTAETEALRARDALVASVSHELRTPLTSILGYVELALDAPGLPEQVRKNLEVADRNAERLLVIVGDVLAASAKAGEQDGLAIAPREIDLAMVVRAAAESLTPSATARGVTIDLGGVGSASAYADPMRMQQVMENLLSNAIKYNRAGGSVTVRISSDGRWSTVAVTDTGVGLGEDDLAHVFQRYYRGAAVRASGVTGNGLGLAISRDIVRRQGGDMIVSSELGVGSTFAVTLPSHRPGHSAEEPR